MKNTLLILLTFTSFTVYGQQLSFQRILKGMGSLSLLSVQQTQDGGYIGAGYAQMTHVLRGADNYVVKFDSTGNITWKFAFGSSKEEVLDRIQQTSDGNYIAVGNKYDLNNREMAITKISATGAIMWYKILDAADWEYGYGVTEIPGGYIFTGSVSDNDTYGYVVKTNSAGNILWTKKIELPGEAGSIYSASPTADGGIFLTGIASYFSPDVWLMKMDANGNIEWMKRYDTGLGEDKAYHGQPTADGGYIVAGISKVSLTDTSDIFLAKTDDTGGITWTKTFDLGMLDETRSLVVCKDGGYLITGYSRLNANTQLNSFVIKTTDTGGIQWIKKYGGQIHDMLLSGMQTKDSGFVFSGVKDSFNPSSSDAYLVKTDASGNSGCNQLDTMCTAVPIVVQEVAITSIVHTGGVAQAFGSITDNSIGIPSTLCTTVNVPQMTSGSAAIDIYPNPAREFVKFDIAEAGTKITLTNTLGNAVYQKTVITPTSLTIDLTPFANGVYVYTAETKTGELYRGKLVISR